VVSDGGYIEKESLVEVVEVEGNRIVVRAVVEEA
jgi:membrane-bound ClpP family serine protease